MTSAESPPPTLTVLVTRPTEQGKRLCASLQQAGYQTHLFPVLEIVPVTNETQCQHISKVFSGIEKFSGIIIVSVNAAECAMQWFSQTPPPSQQPIYTVGKTTAEFLQSQFQQQTIIFPEQKMDSEGLLAQPSLQNVDGKSFLLLRGQGGRELLAQTLMARGAHIETCELYSRQIPHLNTEGFAAYAASLSQAAIDADCIVINSVDSLNNFMQLFSAAEDIHRIKDTALVVPSNRVAHAAKDMGFAHIICADNATDSAIMNALLTLKP